MMIHSLPTTCSELSLAPLPSSRTCYRRGWLSGFGFWQLTGVTGADSSKWKKSMRNALETLGRIQKNQSAETWIGLRPNMTHPHPIRWALRAPLMFSCFSCIAWKVFG